MYVNYPISSNVTLDLLYVIIDVRQVYTVGLIQSLMVGILPVIANRCVLSNSGVEQFICRLFY